MKTKKEDAKALEIVRNIVHEWDPYQLLASGAPIEEFDSELKALVSQLPSIHSAADAAHALSRVFSSAFQAEKFTPEKCSDAGKKLYRALCEAGFDE